jgi:hypothetical protein
VVRDISSGFFAVTRKDLPDRRRTHARCHGHVILPEAGLLSAATGLRLVTLVGSGFEVTEAGSPDAGCAVSAPKADCYVFAEVAVDADDRTGEVSGAWDRFFSHSFIIRIKVVLPKDAAWQTPQPFSVSRASGPAQAVNHRSSAREGQDMSRAVISKYMQT